MNPIRNFFDTQRRHFRPDGRLARWEPFFESMEKVFFGTRRRHPYRPPQPGQHQHPALHDDVIVMLLPCLFFGMYNVGLQAYSAAGQSASFAAMVWFGFLKVIPLVIISYLSDSGGRSSSAAVRKHPISEGVFVTAMLFPP